MNQFGTQRGRRLRRKGKFLRSEISWEERFSRRRANRKERHRVKRDLRLVA